MRRQPAHAGFGVGGTHGRRGEATQGVGAADDAGRMIEVGPPLKQPAASAVGYPVKRGLTAFDDAVAAALLRLIKPSVCFFDESERVILV